MALVQKNMLQVPFKDQISDGSGLISSAWQFFFRAVFERLNPLGIEQSYPFTNHATTAYEIDGFTLNPRSESAAIIDYFIQRISTSDEKYETGSLYVYHKAKVNEWALAKPVSTGTSGVTLSITTTGKMKYQAPALAGTKILDRIVWRTRTMSAKTNRDQVGWT